MSSNFDWQTDEEADWTVGTGPTQKAPFSTVKRRWIRPLLMSVSLSLLAVLIVAWQINRRAKAATQGVEDEIIASYELMLAAADENDAELFRSLHATNGRNSTWARYLDRLMTQNSQLLNGYRPGLMLLNNKPQVEEIMLTPDLTGAELTTSQTYAVYTAVSVTETITLRHAHNYQLQEDGRWLMVAPDDDFWGNQQTYESTHLQLTYPARDEAIMQEVIAVLDKNLEHLCRWFSEMPTLPPCPDDMQFRIHLKKTADSLVALDPAQDEGSNSTFSGNLILFFPAPTLVGMPADALSQQALIDFYVQQVMVAIAQKLKYSREYDWYRFSGFNNVSLDWFLVQEGITAWPPRGIPIGHSDPPPVPWPQQNIALTCLDEAGQNVALVRLDPESGSWATEWTDDDLINADRLSQQHSFVQYYSGGASSWAVIESDGTPLPIPETDEAVEYMYVNGRYIIAPAPSPEEYGPSTLYYVLDWEQCFQGDCQWHDLPGYPILSPDKTQFLVEAWREGAWVNQLLYGENLDGPFELIAEGNGLVWLDEETISYRQVDESDDYSAVLVAAPIGGESETLLVESDLKTFLSPEEENIDVWFNVVGVASDSLLINVYQFKTYSSSSEPPQSQNYLLLFDRQSKAMTVVAEGASVRGVFGGNGRYVVTTQIDSRTGMWSLNRYDIASKQTETLLQYDMAVASSLPLQSVWSSAMDWSEDGQWLMVLRNGFLVLLVPDHHYKQVIIPDMPGCFSAAWIRP